VLERSINTTADGAIPVMLMLLGLSLAQIKLVGRWRSMLIACGFKLMLSPLIALRIVLLVGLEGIPFNVAILQSAAPTAVLASALASEFGSDAPFVAATTLLSTILSIITSAVIIFILQG
jgi:predicted permease